MFVHIPTTISTLFVTYKPHYVPRIYLLDSSISNVQLHISNEKCNGQRGCCCCCDNCFRKMPSCNCTNWISLATLIMGKYRQWKETFCTYADTTRQFTTIVENRHVENRQLTSLATISYKRSVYLFCISNNFQVFSTTTNCLIISRHDIL